MADKHTFEVRVFEKRTEREHVDTFTVEGATEEEALQAAQGVAAGKGHPSTSDLELSDLSVAASAGGVESAPPDAKEEPENTPDTTEEEGSDESTDTAEPEEQAGTEPAEESASENDEDQAEKADETPSKSDSKAEQKPSEPEPR